MMALKNAGIRGALVVGFLASSGVAQTTGAEGVSVGAQEPASAPPEKAGDAAAPRSEAEVAPGDDPKAEQAVPLAASKVVCGLDKFEGMDERDARAAAAMICQTLRRYGELVEDNDGEFSQATEGYRVRAYKLGQRMLVELSHEKPVGTVKTSVRVEIQSVEELVEESERLVSALKEGKPLKKVERAEQATPPAKKEPGVLMYAGIIGFMTVGDFQVSAGGADLGLSIPVQKFSFTPHARLAFGEASLGGLGLDLRYYFTGSENAFFLGAGLGAMGIGVSDTDGSASGGGPAGSLLFGVEFNRKERTRVGFNLRADFPAFPLRADWYDLEDEGGSNDESAFVVPVGFNLYLTL